MQLADSFSGVTLEACHSTLPPLLSGGSLGVSWKYSYTSSFRHHGMQIYSKFFLGESLSLRERDSPRKILEGTKRANVHRILC